MSTWCHEEQLFPGADFPWVELGLAANLTQEEAGPGDLCDFNIRGTKLFLLHKTNMDCCVLPLQHRRSHEAQPLLNLRLQMSGVGERYLPLDVCWLVFHASLL